MAVAISLLLVALAGTLLGRLLLGVRARRQSAARRGFVSVHPDWRNWLRQHRLVEAEDFLQLEALIVSGHPGRQVGRLTLGDGDSAKVVYLKREVNVRWTTRLTNFLAGSGWVSRCVREATVLEALERDGLAGPRWLATGEDDKGRAFLLVEEVPNAVPLVALLARLTDPVERRRLAAEVGRTLGRLHEAGFFHRDLYAKHVLVCPDTFQVILLDWQRAWRGAWLRQNCRVRDLATLHATLTDQLATSSERMACLFAYLGGRRPATRRRRLRLLLSRVQRKAAELRQKRHIREKRQLPTAEAQAWIYVEGEALSITPALATLTSGQSLDWLSLDHQPVVERPVSRRWVVLPGRKQVLLERRRQKIPLQQLFRYWLLGQPIISNEQRRATLLWRLERHGVPVPRVLAAGRKIRPARVQDSFLLSEPPTGTMRLGGWLPRADTTSRRRVLRELGHLMARMHEACCYGTDDLAAALAVLPEPDGTHLVLDNVEGINPLRRPTPGRAVRDLQVLHDYLATQGCGSTDWHEVRQGYDELEPTGAAVAPPAAASDRPFPSGGRSAVNPPTFWQRLTRGWRRLRQRADWADFVGPGWPDRIMDAEVTDDFHAKQGRSTGRWCLASGDQRLAVYLKRHHVLPFWQGLLAAVWPGGNWSPAMAEYEHLEWARRQGVPVPATVAAGEFLDPWGRLRSFLAVEELTDMLPLHEAIPLASEKMPPDEFRRWKRGLAAEMARLARLLHDRRHFHKDLYLCHFFIHTDHLDKMPGAEPGSWRGNVFLIDLHRLTHHPRTWWWWQLKDLAQLVYSSEVKGIDARDQLAFWMHYRGPGAQRWSSRWLRRLVVFKWHRYARHNQRRKRRLAEKGRE